MTAKSRAATGRIKRMLGKGTTALLSGNVSVMVARLFSTVILTRLLTTEDYGVVGIVWLLLYIFVMLSDVGFYPFVMKHPKPDNTFLDEIWTLRLLRAVVLTLLMILVAEPLAWYMNKPELRSVIMVGSLTIALEGLSSMAFATAPRDGLVRRVTILEVVPHIVSIFSSILLAYYLRNYWALIYSIFITAALRITLSYTMFPNSRRKLRFSRERAAEVWRFGRYVSGSSILQIFVSQTDRIILARLFPIGEFGIYSLANNLAQVPHAVTGKYASHIVLPLLSKTTRGAEANISDAYYRAGAGFRLLYMLGVGAFISSAPLIVNVLYDERYSGAAFYLQWLAAGALFTLSVTIASDALVALGRVSHYLTLNVLRVVWLAASGFLLFYVYGPVGIVYALVSTQIFGQFYSWWALRRAEILNPAKEVQYLVVAAAGYALGSLVNAVGFRILA